MTGFEIFLASALISGISSYITNSEAEDAQAASFYAQQDAQEAQTRREMGLAQQKSDSMMTSAANRNKVQQPMSYSFLGENLKSLQGKQTSSGTF